MRTRKDAAFVLVDLLIVVGIICALAGVLAPVIQRVPYSSAKGTCQANLRLIGQAISLYVQDYSQHYPTNKPTGTSVLTQRVYLAKTDGPTGNPTINFVDGLATYLSGAGGSATASWECPAVADLYYNVPWNQGRVLGYGVARNTYAFNFGLLEKTTGSVSHLSSTLLLRETGTNEHAWCCAAYDPRGTTPPTTRPTDIFLATDSHVVDPANINKKPHGDGSNLLCADGHVIWLSSSAAVDTNVRNDAPAAPGKWVLCSHGVPVAPRLWITP